MFGTSLGTIDHELEGVREADRREIRSICEQQARLSQRLTAITRRADDRGDWQAAGCSSNAQWLAQVTNSDFSTAKRITVTGEALRELPALDEALASGALTLDQVAAGAAVATPETDAQIARLAVGKAPSQIARAARTLVPPTVADDAELYRGRALSMTWTPDARELVFSGRLPLEQGVAFEQAIWNIAKSNRAEDKKIGPTLTWPQYTADALVALATSGGASLDGVRRSPVTVIVHLSEDQPPMIEGAGTISAETAERLCCDARRLTIQPRGDDLMHSRIGRCASWPQMRALYKRANGQCQYPGCTVIHELRAHHLLHERHGGRALLENLILLCNRHHDLIHDHHIRTTGSAADPDFTDQAGRAITAQQPHAPPR